MKRINHVFDKILSTQNLWLAIDTVNRTHRWHHYPNKPNRTVLWIETTMEERIKELREIIQNGFVPSPVKKKTRYDRNARKWREICEPRLWPDQYVHHALIQVIEPVMMRGMDLHCCGSIKGRGAHYGIRIMKKWMRNDKSGTRYCLEMDIRHFYDSLDPHVVLDRMKELIKDSKALDLIERITAGGIQIGAYCSQWFANTVLQPLDQLIRQSGASHYLRYMDNFTIFSNRKKTLRKILKAAEDWLHDHGLELKSNWQIYPTRKRLPNALGYRYGRTYTLLRKHSLLTLKQQLRKFYHFRERHIPVTLHFVQGLLSRFGMLKHCNSVHLYARIVRPKTQRSLKDIVRTYQREVQSTWNMYLAQYAAAA